MHGESTNPLEWPSEEGYEVREDRGAMASEISRAIVGIHAKHYGRGPTKAKTIVTEDVVVCSLEDIYTQVEKTLIRAGRFEDVRNLRLAFQLELEAVFVAAVEETIGRKVRAFLSQVHKDPPIATEIFILEPRGRSATTEG